MLEEIVQEAGVSPKSKPFAGFASRALCYYYNIVTVVTGMSDTGKL